MRTLFAQCESWFLMIVTTNQQISRLRRMKYLQWTFNLFTYRWTKFIRRMRLRATTKQKSFFLYQYNVTDVSLTSLFCKKCLVYNWEAWKSKTQVTCSNPRVRRLKAWVARLKARVRRLKARVEAIKQRVR